MNPAETKCSLCGVTEDEHRTLYGTPLGHLAFSFQPDKGTVLQNTTFASTPTSNDGYQRFQEALSGGISRRSSLRRANPTCSPSTRGCP